jgi:hypothetical protein
MPRFLTLEAVAMQRLVALLRLKERLDIEHQRYYIKLEIEVKPNPKCD